MNDFISYEKWKEGRNFKRTKIINGPHIEGFIEDVVKELLFLQSEYPNEKIYVETTTDGYDIAYNDYHYTTELSEDEKLDSYFREKSSYLYDEEIKRKETERKKEELLEKVESLNKQIKDLTRGE